MLLLAAFLLLPVAAVAKEESKIKIQLENLVGGNKFEESGAIRTQMADGGAGTSATLALRVKRLAGDTEYILMSDGDEIGRVTTDADGHGVLHLDLLADSVDPRGTFMSVNDGSMDVLGAWLYGPAVDDPSRAKIKERTTLDSDDTTNPTARVRAGYMLLPNGMARFAVSLKGLADGDYDICIDGAVEAMLTTNPAGNAKVVLKTKPQVGKGKGNKGIGKGPAHNKKKKLALDPRDALIEVKRSGDPTVLFSGRMRAQIDTLNSCAPASATDAMVLDGAADPGQIDATGSVTTGNEDSCDAIFEVELAMLLPGDYELHVDGALIDTSTVMDDGSGTGAASLYYDENPDSGERVLDFAVGPGSLIEIIDLAAGGVVLSATLP